MLDLNTILANLTPGQLPVAIGTSFAIESSLGILDKDNFDSSKYPSVNNINKNIRIPTKTKPPVDDVKEIWINIRTVFRNIYNALESNIKDNLTPKLANDAVLNEMNMIMNIYQQYTGNNVKIVFYVCTYQGMPSVFPNALHRDVKSDKQKHYLELEQSVAFYCTQKLNNIKKFNVKFQGMFPKTMIITHLAVDLLWKNCFDSLLLLESHTGSIKKHPEWNKKLTGGKDMLFMPFNYFTIQVFGDNGNFFKPFVHAIKKDVLELAKQRNWTAVTTKDKIIFDLKTLRDIPVRNFLLDVCKKW